MSGPGEGNGATMAAVARGISWVGLGHIVSQLAWFGSLLLVAALVPPGEFASVTIAMVVVQVAWLFVGSGTRGALVLTPHVSRAQVRRGLVANVATGLALGLAAALLAGPLLSIFTPGADPLVLQVLALSVALYGFSIVPLALLQKEMQFKRHATANASAALLASGLAVAAAFAGLGVWALVLRQVLFQALLAGFAWAGARALVPAASADEAPARRDPVAQWFLALAVIAFVSLNIDYVVVGRFTDVTQVGLYSLAFAMAFAPVTQFAWQIGKVLFASATRTEDAAAVAAHAAKAARLTALVVWPLAAPTVVLAPVVLPALLGPEWRPMILPFQLLLIAGAGHAVLAVIREFLLGTGNVRSCLRVDVAWLAATVLALLALVPAFGITGAAVAHVALLVPLTCVYVTLAARRLGLQPAALWRSMRLILVAVAIQGLLTGIEAELTRWAGASSSVAAALGALAGVLAVLLVLAGGETPPQREIAAVLRAAARVRAPRAAPAVQPAIPGQENRGLARRLAGAGLAIAALAGGAVAASDPRVAALLVAAGVAWLLAVRAPVAHLLALVALTAIVPQAVQARVGSGSSIDAAGILPSDLLLLTGLARALLVLPRQPLRRLTSVAVALTTAFLLVGAFQLLHAMALGRPISGAGGEFRALLGFGALFVALPILADPRQRRRLFGGLAWLGLGLGVWGVLQFALRLRFTDVDFPLDPASFQTAGRVVGLFAFPVAATIALAVLTGGQAGGRGVRALLAAVVITNVAAVVLTFERTFLLVTLLGFGLVFLRGTWRQRTRLVVWAPASLACTAIALVLLAPATVPAYKQRLATLTNLAADPAVQYRAAESRMVAREISARPLGGSALGATILIGRPGTNTAPVPRRHAENGFLWLAWKAGIPGALVMCALLALAVAAPRVRGEERSAIVLRCGCQAGLAAVVVASLSFPSFNQIGITAVMGVLVAACLAAELALPAPSSLEVRA
jgi:O-antigen/teichoic acid export membrane protein